MGKHGVGVKLIKGDNFSIISYAEANLIDSHNKGFY